MDSLKAILRDFHREIRDAAEQYKHEVDEIVKTYRRSKIDMALDPTTIALIARIDAATNGIAARLQAFVDAALNGQGATPAEINAALQPEIDKLEGIASNPNDPLPLGISISPTIATVPPGATQAFAATVSGGDPTTQSQGAKFTAISGTIDSTGLYTAPTAVPASGVDTVMAAAKADLTITASAVVTVGAVPLPASAVKK